MDDPDCPRPMPLDLLPGLVDLAHEAGRAVMSVYDAPGRPTMHQKSDDSPVTAADLAADQVILSGLARLWPGLRVVSEETPGRHSHANADAGYFLVDPLDGTREFLARNGEFTVNIAWVVAGQAVAGVVHAPALGETFWGQDGQGAFRGGPGRAAQAIRAGTPPPPAGPWKVLGSRSHGGASTGAWLSCLPATVDFLPAGSSLKFCRMAEGQGDLYPRFGPTHHWDTAAGQAVLEAAGGAVFDAGGQPLRYRPGSTTLNPHFVALSHAGLWGRLPPFPA